MIIHAQFESEDVINFACSCQASLNCATHVLHQHIHDEVEAKLERIISQPNLGIRTRQLTLGLSTYDGGTLHRSLPLLGGLRSFQITMSNNDRRLYDILEQLRREVPSFFTSLNHIFIKPHNPASASDEVALSDFNSFLALPSVRSITAEGVSHPSPTFQQLREFLRMPNVSATTLKLRHSSVNPSVLHHFVQKLPCLEEFEYVARSEEFNSAMFFYPSDVIRALPPTIKNLTLLSSTNAVSSIWAVGQMPVLERLHVNHGALFPTSQTFRPHLEEDLPPSLQYLTLTAYDYWWSLDAVKVLSDLIEYKGDLGFYLREVMLEMGAENGENVRRGFMRNGCLGDLHLAVHSNLSRTAFSIQPCRCG